MKRLLFPIGFTSVFAAMLFFPEAVFSGASDGLLLWFQIIIPTLFPFLLITNLLLASGGLSFISRILQRPFRFVFGVSEKGAFAVLSGFLCGYPMGAKVTADLLRKNLITHEEGQYLLSFCNNTSPVFIINFIVWKTLKNRALLLPSLIVLMSVPVMLSFLFRKLYLKKGWKSFPDNMQTNRSVSEQPDISFLDSCMMNSFEAIVKVGGYIILFSVLLSLLPDRAINNPVLSLPAAALEVTNGILIINRNYPSVLISWPLIMGLTSFGGLCSAAQTQCMTEGTGLKIRPYIIQKLAAAAAASLLAYTYLIFIF